VVEASLPLKLETPRIIKRTKMMKILEWIKEWMESRPSKICYFCHARESEDSRLALFHCRDLLVCSDCIRLPHCCWALDSMLWDEYPEEIPACKHCHKVVPPDQLEPVVTLEWYFCAGCATNSDIIRYWERINRRLRQRRARELGVKLVGIGGRR